MYLLSLSLVVRAGARVGVGGESPARGRAEGVLGKGGLLGRHLLAQADKRGRSQRRRPRRPLSESALFVIGADVHLRRSDNKQVVAFERHVLT